MAIIQKQFEQFNENIKIKRFEQNETLREKRDIIRDKLKDKLPAIFEAHKETNLVPRFYDQGSYEMNTGVKPLDGDYDIDQGVYFDTPTDSYPDPVVLKRRVFDALYGHTKEVQLRRSCVTVFYQRDGEDIYHVDLAIYSDGSQNADGKSRLAKGKVGSSDENKFWEVSSPKELAETIRSHFADANDRKQFRRIVRYYKRWRDNNFSSAGNAKPSGIALTVLVSELLVPRYIDSFTGNHDDLLAIEAVTTAILSRFLPCTSKETGLVVDRLEVSLPIEPWGDLLEKMSDNQMSDFKAKLEKLQASLQFAASIKSESEACKELQTRFGKDFPVPDDKARIHVPAIVSASNSA